MELLVATVVHHPLDTRITYRQIAALTDAGHEVCLAAPWSAYHASPPEGVLAVDLPRAVGRDRLTASRQTRDFLAEHGRTAAVVLVHDPELVPAAMGTWADRAVWDVHEDTTAQLVDKPWLPRTARPLARRAVNRLERLAEERIRLILAESGYADRFARPHPVVPNLPWVPDEVAPPDERRVVYLGRISRGRGAEALLSLAERLPDDVDLELIGPADADVQPALEHATATGRLWWTSFLPNDEALARLQGAAVGVSLLRDEPNYRHSTPTKVLEYLAHGVPVVTTPNPQAARVVRDAGAGLVVPFDDVEATVRAVQWLLDHPADRHQLGASGHDAARRHYDWRPHAEQFVALLEDIPKGGHSWPG